MIIPYLINIMAKPLQKNPSTGTMKLKLISRIFFPHHYFRKFSVRFSSPSRTEDIFSLYIQYGKALAKESLFGLSWYS